MASDEVDCRLVEVLKGVLRPAHITQSDQAAIGAAVADHARGAAGKHQVFELLHRAQVALHQHRQVGGIVGRCRRAADAAAHHDLVLGAQGVLHIQNREVEAAELGRIYP